MHSDEAMALPLWIDGHAYLMMAERFFDVVDPASGAVLRRVPLTGAEAAAKAAASAQAALPHWALGADSERLPRLVALGEALAGLAGHFARLIAEETGKPLAEAEAEVAEAVRLLAEPWAMSLLGGAVVAVVVDDSAPLANAVALAAPALAAGGAVILKPSPRAPGAAFALAELATRAGVPDGVLNLIHGDEAAIEGLCAAEPVARIAYAGRPALGDAVRAIAGRHGKPFVSNG